MAAKKKKLADLKDTLGIKHACALALLDHPDPDERETLEQYLTEYIDINTYREAVDYLRQEQNDPRNQLLCEECGWTNRMVCPECPGCGCYNYQCSGWRHQEDLEETAAATGEPIEAGCPCGHYGDPHHCCECGAEGPEYDYHCVCGTTSTEEEDLAEDPQTPHLQPQELQTAGGWGSSSTLPLLPGPAS